MLKARARALERDSQRFEKQRELQQRHRAKGLAGVRLHCAREFGGREREREGKGDSEGKTARRLREREEQRESPHSVASILSGYAIASLGICSQLCCTHLDFRLSLAFRLPVTRDLISLRSLGCDPEDPGWSWRRGNGSERCLLRC